MTTDIAWASYNNKTGSLLGISWIKPTDEPSIEIDKDVAILFLTGVNNLISYKVTETDDGLQLIKLEDAKSVPLFWSLTPVEDLSSYLKLTTTGTKIVITIVNLPELAMLFATEKNDPTWLSHTWNLHTLPIKNNKITISLQNANSYSFYMSKINEV